jgi:hypothetical protein
MVNIGIFWAFLAYQVPCSVLALEQPVNEQQPFQFVSADQVNSTMSSTYTLPELPYAYNVSPALVPWEHHPASPLP